LLVINVFNIKTSVSALPCNSQIELPKVLSSSSICPTKKYNRTGWIYSPGFPSTYDSNVQCNYDLTCSDGEIIDLEFSKFKMTNGTDFLDLDDGIRLLRSVLFGHWIDRFIKSTFSD
jgi:hypothetical protein